jgi:hypothetical protein
VKKRFLLVAPTLLGLVGCDDTPSQESDFASGPAIQLERRIEQESPSVSEGVNDNVRPRLLDTLPQGFQAFDDEIAFLWVNGSLAPVAVDRSLSPVPIAVRAPLAMNLGIFLRYSNRPLVDCPESGTPLADGVAALDLADRVASGPGSLRRYYDDEYFDLDWDLTDRAFEVLGRYYFKGCVVQRAAEVFTGGATNQVEVEIVNRLPDLEILSAHVFSGGPRQGELFIWVQDQAFRSDIRGESFGYRIESSTGVILEGTTTLNTGSWALIDIGGTALRLPADGNEHTVMVAINVVEGPGGSLAMPAGGIPELNYRNNIETVTWQVKTPAFVVLERIRVHENCDQRTPGDWIGRMIIVSSGRQWRIVYGELDVEDGRTYPGGRTQRGLATFRLDNHPRDATLRTRIAFEDCDRFQCGEEWGEFPFGVGTAFTSAWEDTGWAEARLTPADRAGGAAVEVFPSVPTENRDVCSERPFTATFRLMNPAQARDEGYEVTCALDSTNTFTASSGRSSCQ